MTTLTSICVYCGSGFGSDPAFEECGVALGRAMAEAGIVARLWRRQCRPDGGRGPRRARPWRPRLRHHPGIPEGARTDDRRRAGAHRRPGHAHAQAHDVREGGRLRGAARRRRNAGGARRADDLGAARPAHQADPDRQRRGLLEPAAAAPGPHGRDGLHPQRLRGELPRDGRGGGDRARCSCAKPREGRALRRFPALAEDRL